MLKAIDAQRMYLESVYANWGRIYTRNQTEKYTQKISSDEKRVNPMNQSGKSILIMQKSKWNPVELHFNL